MVNESDRDWRQLANDEPYWAVLTCDEYRRSALDEEAKRAFFASGEVHVAQLLSLLSVHFGIDSFRPKRSLDFGCGVGRLLLPLAAISDYAVGVDVAEAMLKEAECNVAAAGLTNVSLVKSDDSLSQVRGVFDLVHTFIVLQHIDPARGQAFTRQLINRIAPGGIGALHITYSRRSFGDDVEREWPPAATTHPENFWPSVHRAWSSARRWLKQLNPRKRRVALMKVNPYTLNPLMHVIQAAGVGSIHLEFTDHGGEWGVWLIFQKP